MDAARFIDHIGSGRRLDDLIAFHLALAAAFTQQSMKVAIGNQRAVQRRDRAALYADRRAAGDGDQDVLDTRVGMVLRGGNRFADRLFGFDDTGDGGGFNAIGLAQRGAHHAEISRLRPSNQTDRLRRADIQNGHEAGAECRCF